MQKAQPTAHPTCVEMHSACLGNKTASTQAPSGSMTNSFPLSACRLSCRSNRARDCSLSWNSGILASSAWGKLACPCDCHGASPSQARQRRRICVGLAPSSVNSFSNSLRCSDRGINLPNGIRLSASAGFVVSTTTGARIMPCRQDKPNRRSNDSNVLLHFLAQTHFRQSFFCQNAAPFPGKALEFRPVYIYLPLALRKNGTHV